MKKRILPIIMTMTIFLSMNHITMAHEAHGEKTLEDNITDILTAHGVSSPEKLDCDEITDEEWETLGESIMDEIHPNEDEHTYMDEMMGGEGSNSLQTAHIQMAKQYLDCTNNEMGVMGMFGGMMGGLYGDYGPMMSGSFGWGYGLLTIALQIAGIAALVAITRYFWKKGNNMK